MAKKKKAGFPECHDQRNKAELIQCETCGHFSLRTTVSLTDPALWKGGFKKWVKS